MGFKENALPSLLYGDINQSGFLARVLYKALCAEKSGHQANLSTGSPWACGPHPPTPKYNERFGPYDLKHHS